ncbi:MAG: carbonic anhydrase [Methanobacteriota archaeon]|nr:MAG: carbonic anhydrase [Euryarchaeota archaeon]
MPDTPLLKDLLSANSEYARTFDRSELPLPPAKKLAILACMDARIDVHAITGLREGDTHVIRNAGGIATEDALRSFIISTELLGTREFLVVSHTDCGMLTFKDRDLQDRLSKKYGTNAEKINFNAFSDLEENVRTQVQRIKTNAFIPKGTPVTGFIYDVKTGKLNRVT